MATVIDWETEDRRWRRHVVESRLLLALLTVLWLLVVILTLLDG